MQLLQNSEVNFEEPRLSRMRSACSCVFYMLAKGVGPGKTAFMSLVPKGRFWGRLPRNDSLHEPNEPRAENAKVLGLSEGHARNMRQLTSVLRSCSVWQVFGAQDIHVTTNTKGLAENIVPGKKMRRSNPLERNKRAHRREKLCNLQRESRRRDEAKRNAIMVEEESLVKNLEILIS